MQARHNQLTPAMADRVKQQQQKCQCLACGLAAKHATSSNSDGFVAAAAAAAAGSPVSSPCAQLRIATAY
jgi:hypothetical protein